MKFEQGQNLTTRFISNSDTKLTGQVLQRTAKMITIDVECEGVKRCKVYTDSEGREFCYPLGRYSMAPIFRAR